MSIFRSNDFSPLNSPTSYGEGLSCIGALKDALWTSLVGREKKIVARDSM